MILELCGDEPLVELLTVDQLRRVRSLRAGATRAELSLDEVEVVGDGRVLDTFEELEVELKRGDETPLAALAELFDSDGGFRPVSRSKLDRAIKSIGAAMPSMPPELQGRWLAAPPELLAGRPEADRPGLEADGPTDWERPRPGHRPSPLPPQS